MEQIDRIIEQIDQAEKAMKEAKTGSATKALDEARRELRRMNDALETLRDE